MIMEPWKSIRASECAPPLMTRWPSAREHLYVGSAQIAEEGCPEAAAATWRWPARP